MSEAECPESQVRGSVRDGPQTVFNGVDSLVHKDLSKIKLPDTTWHEKRTWHYSCTKEKGRQVLQQLAPPLLSHSLFSLGLHHRAGPRMVCLIPPYHHRCKPGTLVQPNSPEKEKKNKTRAVYYRMRGSKTLLHPSPTLLYTTSHNRKIEWSGQHFKIVACTMKWLLTIVSVTRFATPSPMATLKPGNTWYLPHRS